MRRAQQLLLKPNGAIRLPSVRVLPLALGARTYTEVRLETPKPPKDKVDPFDEWTPETAPSHFVERFSPETNQWLSEDVQPRTLLVHAHRDYHFLEVLSRWRSTRVLRKTGDERKAMDFVKALRQRFLARTSFLPQALRHRVREALLGIKENDFRYFFRFKHKLYFIGRDKVDQIVQEVKAETKAKFEATFDSQGKPRLTLFVTGATGFLGNELLKRVAADETVVEVVSLVWDQEAAAAGGAPQFGALVLDNIGVPEERRGKFTFVSGNIEKPNFGLSESDLANLKTSMTHVVHLAASVQFDGKYTSSFNVNVGGTKAALDFSLAMQQAGGPFVQMLGIGTSYIHGRRKQKLCSESRLVFPDDYYNNYYELVKAMSSIMTDNYVLENRLRVVQLCPAIVIGNSFNGNNYGDTKVVNAPINMFGRAVETLQESLGTTLFARTVMRIFCRFPADPTARFDLVPVDRVVEGIHNALSKPGAVTDRIHLATDRSISPTQMTEIFYDELGIRITLSDPVIFRTVTLPLIKTALEMADQPKLARVMEKLAHIFGGYAEWGQPVHEVGNDVRLLGLPRARPDTLLVFRMLVRHNRFVQEWGQIKDKAVLAQREKAWAAFIDRICEEKLAAHPALIPAREFQDLVKREYWVLFPKTGARHS